MVIFCYMTIIRKEKTRKRNINIDLTVFAKS